MKKSILFLAVFVLTIVNVKAQCPTAIFSVSDTICPGQPLIINNNLSTAIEYNWDLCLGDLDSIPTAVTLPQVSATLVYPQNMKVIKEGGNYFGFIANVGSNYVTRYDFGTSLNNTPTVINLSGDVSLSTYQTGIDVVKEGNKWLIFETLFSGNTLVRMELDSITQITPIFTTFAVPGLNNPYSLKLIDHYGFIQNNQSADLIRIDFTGNYMNAPNVMTPTVSTLALNNFGIDIAYDCTTSHYIGYGSSYGYGTIFKIDFGNSLANTPVVTNQVTGVVGTQGLQLIIENGKWYLFAVSNTNILSAYFLGNSLENTPTFLYSSPLTGLADPKNIQLMKEGTEWIGLIPNTSSWSVVRINFPQGCGMMAPGLSSTDQSPTNLQFGAGAFGYQPIQLQETYSDGTVNYFIDSVFVTIPPPISAFNVSSACQNTAVSFTNSSSICYGAITLNQWDFGDTNTSTDIDPVHTYSNAGTYNVTLTVTSDLGLTNSLQSTVIVHENPTAGFIHPIEICAGATVVCQDSSISNDGINNYWEWNFGNNQTGTGITATTTYNTPGIYSIQLTVTTDYGCKDSITRYLTNLPGPLANFSIFNTCIGETALFINETDSNGTTVTNYEWIFGDNSSSTSISPMHNYISTPGNYIVQLIANAINGCIDTTQYIAHIGNKPLPWFTIDVDTICQFAQLHLTDSSFAGAGENISNLHWDFGDGTIVEDSLTLSHSYSTTGWQTITLTVKSPRDCDSTITRTVYVIGSPTANFSGTDACKGNGNTFSDLSTAPGGSIINSWYWDYNDNAFDTTQNSSHIFGTEGQQTVTLITGSNFGCFDTITKIVNVHSLPVAYFGFSKACTNQPIQFTDSSNVNNGIINTWLWNFGSGVSTLQNPQFAFPNDFAYAVTLYSTSQYGCTDSSTRFIIVNKTPEFTITANNHCLGNTLQLQYTPAAGSSSNNAYFWTFGDNTASFLSNPAHLYSTNGDFIVNLQVTNTGNSCMSSQTDTVQVYAKPIASFQVSNSCEEKTLTLHDSSTISMGSITNWNWTFQSNGNSTLQNPTILYSNPGSYIATLHVVSDKGCNATTTGTITINNKPVVSFTPSITFGAPPMSEIFTNTSDSGTYFWDFGDQSTSAQYSPSHIYSDTGIFQIVLTVTNQFGCIDSASTSVYSIIPIRDLGISGISFLKQNNQWVMKSIISNLGNEDAEEFELKAQLDEKSIFYQTFSGTTLKAGETQEFTFNTTFEAGTETPQFFCTEVISVNGHPDTYISNNKLCNTTSNEFDIFTIYPNPFTNIIYLGINSPTQTKIKVSLFDIQGRVCAVPSEFQISKGFTTIKYPLEELNSGIYLIKVNFSDQVKVFRMIKN